MSYAGERLLSMRQALRELRVLGKRLVGIEPRVHETVRRPLEFHGGLAGGWSILAGSLSASAVVVDVGIGEDASFAESIIRKYGCRVYAFDPTPRAMEYVRGLKQPRLQLFERGVGRVPGPSQFFLPSNGHQVSGSLRGEFHLRGPAIQVEVVTIGQLFEMLRCTRINVLKLDIEGSEYDLLTSPEFQRYASAIDQLCIEFHHRWRSLGKDSTLSAVEALTRMGFECAWRCRWTNEEFLFVQSVPSDDVKKGRRAEPAH